MLVGSYSYEHVILLYMLEVVYIRQESHEEEE